MSSQKKTNRQEERDTFTKAGQSVYESNNIIQGGQPGRSVLYNSESSESRLELLDRLDITQRQALITQMGHVRGNQYVQRIMSTSSTSKTAVQRTLQDDLSGQWPEALTLLTTKFSAVGGVIDRQKDAVRNFSDFASESDPVSLSDEALIGAINLVLGSALGGIGRILKSVAARAMRPTLLGATRVTMGTAVNSSQVRSTIRASANSVIDNMTKAGKRKVGAAVSEALRGETSERTALVKFREIQLRALDSIAQEQIGQMIRELARLRENEGEDDEWEAVNALYESFNVSLDQIYTEQFNKMTDIWFTMQVQTVGSGARPGVLQIELADRYPQEGSFRVSGGNLLGSGSNKTIRSRLANRPLRDIAIPKVIKMNGSMGYGILPCEWWIEVTGQERIPEQDTISAPQTRLESFMIRPQQVVSYGGNRWGGSWLAAFHLGLNDLDRDDERNTVANQSAGALRVWNEIKDMTPESIGNSSW